MYVSIFYLNFCYEFLINHLIMKSFLKLMRHAAIFASSLEASRFSKEKTKQISKA